MPSFFDLQKFAHTGIASPDMSSYDKARALAVFGGGAVQTLTDVPPLTFKADGTPLISWSMLGNGQQTGTPTPDNPIQPQFVGVRTGNLFDEDYANISSTAIYRPLFVGDGIFTLSTNFQIVNGTTDIFLLSGNVGSGINSSTNGAYDGKSITATSVGGYVTIAYRKYVRPSSGAITECKTMLNLGSTPLPYEPYGWAEKITNAGQTVPVYLGQTQTVRRIKKLVMTGEENILDMGSSVYSIRIAHKERVAPLCTHYVGRAAGGWADIANHEIITAVSSIVEYRVRDDECQTLADFKAYLTAQYAAGTPVTIWYVLAEPTTGIVNEPLCKIGDYADELHSSDTTVTIPTAKGQNTLTVETDLQPSEMTITYFEEV